MGKIRISLKVKMIGVVLAVALVIACAAVLVSYTVYANTMDTHYETLTMNLARTTASMLDKGHQIIVIFYYITSRFNYISDI